jgi:hypothetical protein
MLVAQDNKLFPATCSKSADFRIAEKMHPIRRVHGVHHSLLEPAPYASPLRILLRELHCTTGGRAQHLSENGLGLRGLTSPTSIYLYAETAFSLGSVAKHPELNAL